VFFVYFIFVVVSLVACAIDCLKRSFPLWPVMCLMEG